MSGDWAQYLSHVQTVETFLVVVSTNWGMCLTIPVVEMVRSISVPPHRWIAEALCSLCDHKVPRYEKYFLLPGILCLRISTHTCKIQKL